MRTHEKMSCHNRTACNGTISKWHDKSCWTLKIMGLALRRNSALSFLGEQVPNAASDLYQAARSFTSKRQQTQSPYHCYHCHNPVSEWSTCFRFPSSYPLHAILIVTLLFVGFPPMVRAAPTDITINEFGVKNVEEGDTAMVFYANVSHTGRLSDSLITARLQMVKCCYQVPPDNISNCDSMKLISGLGVVFHPKETHILYMYFVNFDLYDRQGNCAVRLLSRPTKGPAVSAQELAWESSQEVTVQFKTVLPKPGIVSKLFISLGASSKGYRICDTDNYNALHECSNYNDCLVRYSGGRSLYNNTAQTCEPTPTCGENNFLSIITSRCEQHRDLGQIRRTFSREMKLVETIKPTNAITTGEKHHLSTELNTINRTRSFKKPVKHVVCEHGTRVMGRNGQPNCTCYPGWRSLTLAEWEQSGGIMARADESLPLFHMCTVLLMDETTKGLILVTFLIICITIPFVALCWFKRGKQEESKNLEAPSSSEEEEYEDEEENGKFISSKSTIKVHDEEDADKVISEITNRREPTVSRIPSREDSRHDQPPPPPPPPPPTNNPPAKPPKKMATKTTQAPQPAQADKGFNFPSYTNIQASRSQFPSQQSVPKPQSRISTKPPPAPPPKSTSARSAAYPEERMKVSNARQFSDFEADDRNMNIARQIPSTDELLTMDPLEKHCAHLPISPKPKEEESVAVVVANCGTVELKDNNIILHSMSSEEITQQKKEEWAQFLQFVSKEATAPTLRTSHCSISLDANISSHKLNERLYEDDELAEDESEELSTYPDFQYFHKDHQPSTAVKVRSVPGMMQYHPFSHSAPTSSHAIKESEHASRCEPPTHFVQKAFGDMRTDDLSNRQECFRILSSLSHERLSSQEGGLKGTTSIWSNIASENTKEPSTTPATTTAGSRVVTSCEDAVGEEESYTILRTTTIYGDMGSDVDSDGALEELAAASSPSKTEGRQPLEVDNRVVYGTIPLRNPITPMPQATSNVQKMYDPNPIRQGALESDAVQSDAYLTESSTASSPPASQSVSSTGLWQIITNHVVAGHEAAPCDQTMVNPHTSTAYNIKSSLETALKASRSRSGTNLF